VAPAPVSEVVPGLARPMGASAARSTKPSTIGTARLRDVLFVVFKGCLLIVVVGIRAC